MSADRRKIGLPTAHALARQATPARTPTPTAHRASSSDVVSDRRIADLETQLSARSHEAIVARAEAELAKGILRKLVGEGPVEFEPYGPGRPDMAGRSYLGLDYGIVDLTDAEAALFDTITEEGT
jgi:hypothetical protein